MAIQDFFLTEKTLFGWEVKRVDCLEFSDSILTRILYENTNSSNERIIIDVFEKLSNAEAHAHLHKIPNSYQIYELPTGPDDLGEASLSNPLGYPPAVYWVRGKFCVAISNFGCESVAVNDLAYRIDLFLQLIIG